MSKKRIRLAMFANVALLATSLWFVYRATDRPSDRSGIAWVRHFQPDFLRQYVPVQKMLDWLDPPQELLGIDW